MKIEERFGFAFPDRRQPDDMYKAIFTRPELTLGDIAEYVYVNQGRRPLLNVSSRRQKRVCSSLPPVPGAAFTQLGAKHHLRIGEHIYEPLEAGRFRRVRDGMIAIEIPAAEVYFADKDRSRAEYLGPFLIDIEPVSTTAYARFLNSVELIPEETLRDWFLLGPDDHRQHSQFLHQTQSGWRPIPGTETWPMVLVSWHGAVAYSRWAHGRPFHTGEPNGDIFLPTEWQWEYAARGRVPKNYPWGNEEPTPDRANFFRHQRGTEYSSPAKMPIAPVNIEIGMSPFGLRHMAGNVWQWCSNLYAEDAAVRSERGGSWIGPTMLCRSDYRRGRADYARGRCLGFRCATNHLTG